MGLRSVSRNVSGSLYNINSCDKHFRFLFIIIIRALIVFGSAPLLPDFFCFVSAAGSVAFSFYLSRASRSNGVHTRERYTHAGTFPHNGNVCARTAHTTRLRSRRLQISIRMGAHSHWKSD